MKHIKTTVPGGKLPPQAVELEEAILGALMIDTKAIDIVAGILNPESFYKPAHGVIYQAIFNLFARADSIDMLTVTQELRKMGKIEMVGKEAYVMRLTSAVGSAAHIETHAHIVAELAVKRELISVSTQILEQAFEDEFGALDLLSRLSDCTTLIASGVVGKKRKSGAAFMKQMFETYKKTAKGGLSIIQSGLISLDKAMAGMLGGEVTVLAGRPGMGKTALALSIVRHAAKEQDLKVGVISLEMTGEQLVRRLVMSDFYTSRMAGEYGYPSVAKIRLGQLSELELEGLNQVASQSTYLANLQIDDTAGMNFLQIATSIREMVKDFGVKLVVVDYIQLITLLNSKNSTVARELAEICIGFKNLAKELDIHIVEASQLGKDVDKRADKRPTLGDLKESGGIEENCDNAWLIYRPEYYGITKDLSGNSTEGIVELIAGKVRNAAKSSIFVKADLGANTFRDIDEIFDLPNIPTSKMNNSEGLPSEELPF